MAYMVLQLLSVVRDLMNRIMWAGGYGLTSNLDSNILPSFIWRYPVELVDRVHRIHLSLAWLLLLIFCSNLSASADEIREGWNIELDIVATMIYKCAEWKVIMKIFCTAPSLMMSLWPVSEIRNNSCSTQSRSSGVESVFCYVDCYKCTEISGK